MSTTPRTDELKRTGEPATWDLVETIERELAEARANTLQAINYADGFKAERDEARAGISNAPLWPKIRACGSLEDPGVVLSFPDGASAVYICLATSMAGELWSRINERDMLSTDAVAQSAGDTQAPPPAGAVEQPGRERLEVRSLPASTSCVGCPYAVPAFEALEKIAARGPYSVNGGMACATCTAFWHDDPAVTKFQSEHHYERCAYVIAHAALESNTRGERENAVGVEHCSVQPEAGDKPEPPQTSVTGRRDGLFYTEANAKRLIAMRNAHCVDDHAEVYHELYWLVADHCADPYQPWKEIEVLAGCKCEFPNSCAACDVGVAAALAKNPSAVAISPVKHGSESGAAVEGHAQFSSRYRHVKTGGIYEVTCFAYIEATKTPAIVYRCERTGVCWVRPEVEFYDGRFEQLLREGNEGRKS